MLKQENALITGLATAAVVFAVYQTHMPTVAGVRASAPGNKHIDASRKGSAIIATGMVAAISLIARDPTVFLIGGGAVIAADLAHRLANATDNQSGKLPGPDQAAPPPVAA